MAKTLDTLRPRLLLGLLGLLVAVDACSDDDGARLLDGGGDGNGGSDAATDGARPAGDGLTDGYFPVDQPLPPLLLSCTPAASGFDAEACATVSVVVDRATDPARCELRAGEPRSPQPVLSFVRQDEACVGDKVIEVLFFARPNQSWRVIDSTAGLLDSDGAQVREIPRERLTRLTLQTVDPPAVTFAISVKLGDQLTVTKLEQLR